MLPILALLIAFTAGSGSADDVQFEVRPLSATGDRPTLLTGQPNQCAGAFAADRRTFYLKCDDHLWSLDARTLTWRDEGALDLPREVSRMAFDPSAKRLLFWHGAVGTVYARDTDTGELVRIDRSFDHRNQHGHAAAFDDSTGRIYAFGGYGFWRHKRILTYYDPHRGEWEETAPVPPSSPLMRRSGARAVFSQRQRSLFVLGGSGFPNGRSDGGPAVPLDDLWRVDIASGEWTPVSRMRLEDGEVSPTGDTPLLRSTAYDGRRDIWYLLLYPWVDHDGLVVVACDLRTGAFAEATKIERRLQWATSVAWDEAASRLLVVSFPRLNTADLYPAEVYEVTVGDPDAIPAWIRATADRTRGHNAAGLFIGEAVAVLALGAMAWLLIVRRRGRKRATARRTALEIRLGAAPHLHVAGEPIDTLIGPDETQLLLLLARAEFEGDSFVPNDRIDSELWPDHKNVDYVRKLRNELLHRLEASLGRHVPVESEGRVRWIRSRRSPDDRRRLEYGLERGIVKVVE